MTLDQFYKLIENGTAVWDSGIGLIVMVFTAIQTLLIFYAYDFGKKYLKQHQEKIKEERRLQLIYETMVKVRTLVNSYNEIYSIPEHIHTRMKKERSKAALDQVVDYFFEKFSKKQHELMEVQFIIDTNVDIIDDPILKDVNYHFSNCFGGIFIYYRGVKDLKNLGWDWGVDYDAIDNIPISIFGSREKWAIHIVETRDKMLEELLRLYKIEQD